MFFPTPLIPLAQSGGGTSLMDSIKQFFNDAKSTLSYVGPICIFIGCIGVGCMFALSAFPVTAQWKAQNPNAISALFIGIAIMIFAGTAASLIAFT
jgi:hypothetical protein